MAQAKILAPHEAIEAGSLIVPESCHQAGLTEEQCKQAFYDYAAHCKDNESCLVANYIYLASEICENKKLKNPVCKDLKETADFLRQHNFGLKE